MDKTQAKLALDGLMNFALYKARAVALIDDPDILDQDQFGVCGATSIIYGMLRFDRARFIDLLRGIFNGGNFNGLRTVYDFGSKWNLSEMRVVEVRDYDVLRGRLKQYARKGWVKDLEADAELDFIVSRALGKFLKEAAPSVYTQQKVFSGILKVVVKEGDLSLDQDGLIAMLNMVSAQGVIEIPIVWSVMSLAAALQKLNDRFADGLCQFAIIAVNGADELIAELDDFEGTRGRKPTAADAIRLDALPPAKGPDDGKFEHWIVLNGQITKPGDGYYHMPVWTWGMSFEMLVREAHFQAYCYTFILGRF